MLNCSAAVVQIFLSLLLTVITSENVVLLGAPWPVFETEGALMCTIGLWNQPKCFIHWNCWLNKNGSIILTSAMNCMQTSTFFFCTTDSMKSESVICVQKERKLLQVKRLDLDAAKTRLKKARMADARAAVSSFKKTHTHSPSPRPTLLLCVLYPNVLWWVVSEPCCWIVLRLWAYPAVHPSYITHIIRLQNSAFCLLWLA